MLDFLNNADLTLRVFWYIAIPISIIFLLINLFSIMEIGGMDMETETDSPTDFFSLKNVINFLLGFSWGGISFYTTIPNQFLLVLTAIVIGAIFFYTFKYIIEQFIKLEENNTFDINKSIGQVADVYLRIPAHRNESGIVQISQDGRIREYNAQTDGDEIATGDRVEIIEIINNSELLVKKVSQ